jgi:hypothetical protein
MRGPDCGRPSRMAIPRIPRPPRPGSARLSPLSRITTRFLTAMTAKSAKMPRHVGGVFPGWDFRGKRGHRGHTPGPGGLKYGRLVLAVDGSTGRLSTGADALTAPDRDNCKIRENAAEPVRDEPRGEYRGKRGHRGHIPGVSVRGSVGGRVGPMDGPSGLLGLHDAARVDARPIGRQAPPGGPATQPLDRLAGRHGHGTMFEAASTSGTSSRLARR